MDLAAHLAEGEKRTEEQCCPPFAKAARGRQQQIYRAEGQFHNVDLQQDAKIKMNVLS